MFSQSQHLDYLEGDRGLLVSLKPLHSSAFIHSRGNRPLSIIWAHGPHVISIWTRRVKWGSVCTCANVCARLGKLSGTRRDECRCVLVEFAGMRGNEKENLNGAHFISKIEQKVKKKLKSSYTWSSIPVSHKSVKTCLNTATSAVCLFRKHCILVKDTASAAVGGGGRGTLQQLDWISRGWGGAEGALRLLAPGAGQQVRVDEDYQNTSGQSCPAEGRGGYGGGGSRGSWLTGLQPQDGAAGGLPLPVR